MPDCLVVGGTRPEIIKLSRLLPALSAQGISFSFAYIGQHRDYEMSQLFLEELGLSESTEMVDVGTSSTSPVQQMTQMMLGLERYLEGSHPRFVIAQGDTNATLVASIVALKQGIPLGHVEAGLRSFDWRMPEEHNRRMVDHVSSLLFAPTTSSRENLDRENVFGKVWVTGNTIIDSTEYYFSRHPLHSTIMEKIAFGEYILATFHRAENVDDFVFLEGLIRIIQEAPLPVVIPLHPRTRRRLAEHGLLQRFLNLSNVQVLSPLGYADFLTLMRNSRIIVTDSGGVQEEATSPSIRKRTIIARLSTERSEAIEAGYARLAGTDPDSILREINEAIFRPDPTAPSPFGDGRASERIARQTKKFLEVSQETQAIMGVSH